MTFFAAMSNAMEGAFSAFGDTPAKLLTCDQTVELNVVFAEGYTGAANIHDGLERQNPMADCRTADLPAELARADRLEVDGKSYPILSRKPAKDGTTTLMLGFATDVCT